MNLAGLHDEIDMVVRDECAEALHEPAGIDQGNGSGHVVVWR